MVGGREFHDFSRFLLGFDFDILEFLMDMDLRESEYRSLSSKRQLFAY